MKKSRMLLLFGGLFLMLVGYGAWCGRTFYLRPPMPDLARVPAQARELARKGIEESGILRPERLSFERFKWLLAHPYDSQPARIDIRLIDADQMQIRRADQFGALILFKQVYGWAFMYGHGPQDYAARF